MALPDCSFRDRQHLPRRASPAELAELAELAERANTHLLETNTGGIEPAGARLDLASAWACPGDDDQDVLALHACDDLIDEDAAVVLAR